LTAVATIEDDCVIAFADSDIRPPSEWLARLVEPLGRAGVGAATGYRFYLPERGSFASLLRSAWNAGVLTLLGDHDHNFAWGGSMAITRATFRQAGVEDAWKGVLSDDYALTHAVRRAGFQIEFVPRCVVPSVGTVGLTEVLAWCARQMAITRVYWPNLWRIAGGSQVAYCAFLIAGSMMAVSGSFTVGAMLATVLAAGVVSGALRIHAIQQIAPEWKKRLSGFKTTYVLLAPLVGFLSAYGFFRSLLSRRIRWRGKNYEMKSSTQTLILE
jgi:cellulose synthase/poly-beta-1,6-N-acetylglucosamine synthase-like glycosyltransferase